MLTSECPLLRIKVTHLSEQSSVVARSGSRKQLWPPKKGSLIGLGWESMSVVFIPRNQEEEALSMCVVTFFVPSRSKEELERCSELLPQLPRWLFNLEEVQKQDFRTSPLKRAQRTSLNHMAIFLKVAVVLPFQMKATKQIATWNSAEENVYLSPL